MHPAPSVILFTTLSGAGYGLLFWSALLAMQDGRRAGPLLLVVAIALALVSAGLGSSLLHLGQPQRAWRAVSQWRTSWLSREGVLALATYLPALGLGVLLWRAWTDPSAPVPAPLWWLAGVASALGALATVGCTAMIYASLPPIPAWRHRLVLPVYLLFALFTGGLLLAAIAPATVARFDGLPALLLMLLAAALGVAKRRYWRDIDTQPLPVSLGSAVGLPQRRIGQFECPHTEANYLTHEMGFVLARKHARRLRAIAAIGFGVLPVVLLSPALLLVHLDAGGLYAAAAGSALLGAGVERWLFFAQARHLVSLYYGATPAP